MPVRPYGLAEMNGDAESPPADAIYLGYEDGDRLYWDWTNEGTVTEDAHGIYAWNFTPKSTMVKYLEGLVEDDDYSFDPDSPVGEFLSTVAAHRNTRGFLGDAEAEIFALRRLAEYDQKSVAAGRDVEPATVQNSLDRATTKVNAYQAVTTTLNQ